MISGFGLIDEVFFPKQLGKLVKGGDVAIKKPTKPLQSCTCERTHEHLVMDTICFPINNHLGIECRKMIFWVFYSRKNDLRCDVVWRNKRIHDCLREWLGTRSRGRIRTSLPCRALIKLL